LNCFCELITPVAECPSSRTSSLQDKKLATGQENNLKFHYGMNIKIIDKKIAESELREIAKDFYVEMVKGVVDVEREIIAIGGEYHMDANVVLIENGSKQQNIWGFNWYFDKSGNERIEYVSLINIRPTQGNRTMEVQDIFLRDKMKTIILKYLS